MTGHLFIARPNIRGAVVPTFREAIQRHASVRGGFEAATRYIGGYAGAGTGTRVNGSAMTAPYGALESWWGATATGHGVEWDIGLLETNRDWIINFFYIQNPNNAQVGIYMNDVLVGAGGIEQYAAAATPTSVQRTWSPPASVGRVCHRISLRVTGKHASSGGRYISLQSLVLSRTVGNADRAL